MTNPKPPRKGDKQKALDAIGIDEICERIEADESLAIIAASLDMSKFTLQIWINADTSRSARVREAMSNSSYACDDKALQAIKDLPPDGSPAQIAKARELASHYRWRAKMRDPARYGDKQQVEHSGSLTLEQLVEASLEKPKP